MLPWSLESFIDREKVVVTGFGKVSSKDFKAKEVIGDSPHFRKMDVFCRYAVGAVKLAVKDAQIFLPEEGGVVLSTLWGPMTSIKELLISIKDNGPHLASAFVFPTAVINMATGMVTMEFNIKGPSATIVGELPKAVEYASDLIVEGKAPVMLAGYVEEENELSPVPWTGAIACVLEAVEHARARGFLSKKAAKFFLPFSGDG